MPKSDIIKVLIHERSEQPKMLRFIICEDNKEFNSRISEIINKVMMSYNFEYKLNKFFEYNKEVEQVIFLKNEHKIYILDIELPEISGLEIASIIRENDQESTIIFITSHPECQNDIFYSRLLAIDYINKDKLWAGRLESTLNYSIKKLNKKRVFIFEFNYNSYRLLIDEILYIERARINKRCIIHTESGETYKICASISELKGKLGPSFYQTHQSCLVNVEKIKWVNYNKNLIVFNNNTELYLLSNRNRKGLKEYVTSY